MTKKRAAGYAALAAVVTLLVVVLALNFNGQETQIEQQIQTPFGLDNPQFLREMGVMMGPAIVDGNIVTALNNGDEIFPAMLAAVRTAEHTITFETYIYWSGTIGEEFAEALAERARAGVRVHVLIDWAGGLKMDGELLDRIEDAGAEVHIYRPLKWYSLDRVNNRTHRKLLVIDGRTAFTGGVGIADVWEGDAQDPDHWRDIHFRVEGPVVAQFQAAFLDNWIQTTGAVLNGPTYFPKLDSIGTVAAHLFTSSSEGGSDSMRLMYMMALRSASRTVDLQAAYFVPDDLMIRAILQARARGVRVRILVPGPHIDSDLVRISSKRVWGTLLRDGVEISVYQPTMLHNKMLIVDDRMVSVGSTNFDVRSFELNDEASLNLYDAAFGAQMTAVFEADWADGEPYTLAMWEDRPWRERFAETVLIPIKSQL